MNGWSHWMFGGFWMIFFWGAVIALIVFAARWAMKRNAPRTGTAPQSPLDILNERYARGEIDQEEFERRKRDLSDPPPPSPQG